MEDKTNSILKKMRPLKWERRNGSKGKYQLNMVSGKTGYWYEINKIGRCARAIPMT